MALAKLMSHIALLKFWVIANLDNITGQAVATARSYTQALGQRGFYTNAQMTPDNGLSETTNVMWITQMKDAS